MRSWLKAAGRGALSGAAATVPMAAIQIGAYHAGLSGTVPPDQVTRTLLGRVGLKPTTRPKKDLIVAASHLGFGAAMGSLYALACERLQPAGPPALHGIGFGLAVWTSSYAGWIPAAGILPPPQKARKRGVAANIASHVVYGAVLGWIVGLKRGAGKPLENPA